MKIMKNFLKKHWVDIVFYLVLIIVVIIVLLLFVRNPDTGGKFGGAGAGGTWE